MCREKEYNIEMEKMYRTFIDIKEKENNICKNMKLFIKLYSCKSYVNCITFI